jgi:host factor-I protein
MNRELFRPGLQNRNERASDRPAYSLIPPKKPAPPAQTNAENFYWVKQKQAATPLTIVLADGEVLRGAIEWYDRDCIKLARAGSPNLLIFKHAIRCVCKEENTSSTPKCED